MSNYLLFFSAFTLCYSQELTVEKIWKNREFSEAYVDGFKSMNDGEHFTKISENDGKTIISKHSFSDYNGKGEEILSLSSLKLNDKIVEIDDYEFNQDETKLLFSSERKPIYRRSYSAVFYLYDLKILY
jgi:dipeptidyl-peptidase-4